MSGFIIGRSGVSSTKKWLIFEDLDFYCSFFCFEDATLLDINSRFPYHPEAFFGISVLFNVFLISKHLRINQQIRVPSIRLIDDNDEQLGLKSIEDAIKLAQEQGLDLVEVAPKAQPPVCKIMDYGKYLYRQNKIEQKHKKMQKQAEMKGIRLSFRIDTHDLETKIRQARGFLEHRNSVKVTLVFRGREAAHADLARAKLEQFKEGIKDIGRLEEPPKKQGNSMFMVIVPN
jgi:translation initiation factor IF-3